MFTFSNWVEDGKVCIAVMPKGSHLEESGYQAIIDARKTIETPSGLYIVTGIEEEPVNTPNLVGYKLTLQPLFNN